MSGRLSPRRMDGDGGVRGSRRALTLSPGCQRPDRHPARPRLRASFCSGIRTSGLRRRLCSRVGNVVDYPPLGGNSLVVMNKSAIKLAGPACAAVRDLWDGAVRDFLAGRTMPAHLENWFNSYKGRNDGAVEPNAMPEPYLGPLTPGQAGVFLALNPGKADLRFQGRSGQFADEIRENGGFYSAWATTSPYWRDPWVAANGQSRHHRARLRFLRDWVGDEGLPCSAMTTFELYPWHNRRITGRLGGPETREFVREYVLKPVAELKAPVFAFGARWFAHLESTPGLRVVTRLGKGGTSYGSKAKSRTVIVLQDANGLLVIAEKHSGGAGPPSSEETSLLRKTVDGVI